MAGSVAEQTTCLALLVGELHRRVGEPQRLGDVRCGLLEPSEDEGDARADARHTPCGEVPVTTGARTAISVSASTAAKEQLC